MIAMLEVSILCQGVMILCEEGEAKECFIARLVKCESTNAALGRHHTPAFMVRWEGVTMFA